MQVGQERSWSVGGMQQPARLLLLDVGDTIQREESTRTCKYATFPCLQNVQRPFSPTPCPFDQPFQTCRS